MAFFSRNIHIEYPREIKIGENIFQIEINFFKKKSSSVKQKANVLEFRLSSYLNQKKAEEHFIELLKKISKKLENKTNLNLRKDFSYFIEKTYFYFAKERYDLKYAKIRSIKLRDNIFYINPKIKVETIEKNIFLILSNLYYNRMYNYIKEINSQSFNYNIKDFELKNLNSKWGHCTYDNKIMINIKLLNTEKEILDYVILHELAHIKVKNHSEKFWREVSKFCPNYKEIRKRLKLNPPSLFMEE